MNAVRRLYSVGRSLRWRRRPWGASALLALAVVSTVFGLGHDAASADPRPGPRTLDDYKHFRVATIDLLGRMPTLDEVAAFERPDFDFDQWLEASLHGPAYADRLARVYMDLLRLEPNLNFSAAPSQLYRHQVLDSDGKPVWVYFRENERRARMETDGEFCLSPDETGVVVRARAQPIGTPKRVSKKTLDLYTTLVRPWWLYRDYRAPVATERYGQGWERPDPEFKPVDSLLVEADGKPVVNIRVCREEAQTQETGHLYASGRANNTPPSAKLPGGRLRPPPLDRPFVTLHKGDPVACESKLAADASLDCGCGIGLERCIPGDSDGTPSAFYFPKRVPLGPDEPLDDTRQQAQRWFPYWWSREARRFLADIFSADRDFREVLTGKQTFVNGPLAQFYKTIARGGCCGPEAAFGMIEETEPLFDPSRVPAGLAPQDVSTWKLVEDRGARASGILTMPMFLEKYASARARGAVLFNAFLCKSFVADNEQLMPSTEPNLMIRPGCKTCHATLEPLAAYFARVEPSTFVFLPASNFPVRNPTCKLDRNRRLNGPCNALYDPAFQDSHGAMLRGAYGSPDHADATPVGAGQDISRMPEFAECAVQRVASSFLGRATTPDDDLLIRRLVETFRASGFKMRPLVRAIVGSDAYRRSNNTNADVWRSSADGGPG